MNKCDMCGKKPGWLSGIVDTTFEFDHSGPNEEDDGILVRNGASSYKWYRALCDGCLKKARSVFRECWKAIDNEAAVQAAAFGRFLRDGGDDE